MKQLITWFVRKYKNPKFQFDEHISSKIIFSLIFIRVLASVRSLKLLIHFHFPRNLFLGRGVRFFYFSNIQLGRFVTLGEFTYISGLGSEGVIIGNRVNIGDFSRIIVSTSFDNIGKGITLHDDVAIGEFAYIGGAGGVEIGSACIIGQYFSVHSENHVFDDIACEIREQGVKRIGIKIGKNCWIGSKVTILDGAVVGNGCVIAAGAVVTGQFPDNVIIGGVPAKIIKERTI
ncbi:acyltransferase [Colwellia sp. MB02u-6]|uniref:acyltransferase n=1 Tax=Colwellia sp. MB02u-6 TaxID=2759824 RepID=UPI0015F391DE|nr:acyltransferase [Colwellia sp. MB02u-6]MBA6328373.1 acyltransferase [Colwellia sp. MB02u-6]